MSRENQQREWLVWRENNCTGAVAIKAVSARDAAAEWGRQEDWNTAEYSIAGGATVRVHVCPAYSDGPIQRFDVYAITDPCYMARPVREEEAEE